MADQEEKKTVTGMESLMNNAKITLLTNEQIKGFTCIDISVCDPSCINRIEYNEFLHCLGLDFYDFLKSCLNPMDNDVCYEADTTYNEGDVVNYEGKFYTATKDGVLNRLPVDSRCWKPTSMFSKRCLDILWCNFMGEYISWQIVYDRLPFMYRSMDKGVLTKMLSQSKIGVEIEDLHTMMKAVLKAKETAFENMHSWMERASKLPDYDGCYDLYKGLSSCSCCGDCGCVCCICDDDCLEANQQFFNGFIVG